jgi:hypothetical protein
MKTLPRLSLFSLGLILVLHLAPSQADDNDTVTLKSSDGQVQVVMPAGWVQQPSSNPSAVLEARDEDFEAFVEVIIADRTDPYLSIDDYTRGLRDDILSHLVKSKSSDPEKLTIGSFKTIRYELHGTRPDSKLPFGYFLTVIQMHRHYVEIISWSPEKNFPDKTQILKDAAKQVTYNGDK